MAFFINAEIFSRKIYKENKPKRRSQMDETLLTLLKEALQTPAYQTLLIIAFIYKCGSLKDDLHKITKSVATQFKLHFSETVSHIPPIFPQHKKAIAWGATIALSITTGYLLLIGIAMGTLTILSANELPFLNVIALLLLSLTFVALFCLQWGEAHKIAKENRLF